MYKRLALLALSACLFLFAAPARAQTATPPPGPIYIVQEGDTLSAIAGRFHVDMNELITINNITNPDWLTPGQELVIPGLEDLSGYLTTEIVPFGESLRSMSRSSGTSEAIIRRLNRLVSPTQLYAGVGLVILKQDKGADLSARSTLTSNETLLELAVRQGTDPWTIASLNHLAGTWAALPGDVLYLPSGEAVAGPTGLPPIFLTADLSPLPLTQGKTVQVRIQTSAPVAALNGLLVDHILRFFQMEDGSWAALQGVHALTEPGIYPVRLEATLPDGSQQTFEQMVLVANGNYIHENIWVNDPATIDPAITEPESAWLLSVVSTVTPLRYWQDVFQMPVDSSQYCINSYFGNRRSYNNGAFYSFHTGVDFGVCSAAHPFDVYAPAEGVIVFTGFKTVRGNTIIIDHGWGVYSGLYHQQEEIYVSVGEHVTQGQLIGKIGATGRVTGPHLHWEMWVNGVQVDPLDWLEEAFPR